MEEKKKIKRNLKMLNQLLNKLFLGKKWLKKKVILNQLIMKNKIQILKLLLIMM